MMVQELRYLDDVLHASHGCVCVKCVKRPDLMSGLSCFWTSSQFSPLRSLDQTGSEAGSLLLGRNRRWRQAGQRIQDGLLHGGVGEVPEVAALREDGELILGEGGVEPVEIFVGEEEIV